jgi:hypothetical protein
MTAFEAKAKSGSSAGLSQVARRRIEPWLHGESVSPA